MEDITRTSTSLENISEFTSQFLSSTDASTLNGISENATSPLQINWNTHFSWFDYLFFIILLGFSTLIGIYYAFFSKHKQNTTSEYIFGGKSMRILPVATSLVASFISGQTLLGIPVEVYSNGTQYVAFIIPAIILGLCLSYIYLPLFHELQLTSSFLYLEKRFNSKVRLMASSIYTIKLLIFTPIVIYVPALALSQVTGFSLHLITPIMCSVCVFYTTIGGLRAVVWTDFIQFMLMLGAIFAVIILGTKEVGGFSEVWAAAERGQRLILFNADPSPFARTSIWTFSFGLTIIWMASMGVGQSSLQRFLSLPDLKSAKQSIIIFTIGTILIKFSSIYIGLCVYAKYENCDPVKSGIVQKTDQILPHYVTEIGRELPGLAGLFIAGLFAAGLSSMSTSLNTLSGVFYEDFIKVHLPKATDQEASTIMKWLVVLFGIIVTLLVFVVEQLGPVFLVGVSLTGITAGAFLGIFTIGMVSRSANTKGIIAGCITSIAVVSFILVGAQAHNVSKAPSLPTKIDQCDNNILELLNIKANITSTLASPINSGEEEIFWLFRLSFMYYSLVGFLIMILVTQLVSLLTGGTTQEMDEGLLTPFFRSEQYKQRMQEHRYTKIGQPMYELKEVIKDDSETCNKECTF